MDEQGSIHSEKVKEYIARDAEDRRLQSEAEDRFEARLATKRTLRRRFERIEHTRSQGPQYGGTIFGSGYSGYGNAWTDGKPRIVYPKERKRPRRHLRETTWKKRDRDLVATAESVLVPLRLDIDYDKYKLRDTLLWNLNDTTVAFDVFAEHLCEDYKLPQVGFVNDIVKSVKSQLGEFHPHKFPVFPSELQADSDTSLLDEDLRIKIKLDITVGQYNLTDQFEWDLNSAKNDADLFAQTLIKELGLPADFRSAIVHSICEQCQMYTKTLFLVGYSFDGRPVEDTDVRQFVIAPLHDHLRPKWLHDRFSPQLQELNIEQLERIDKEREREGRRNRRQTRGKRGVNLPDLTDLPKTYRSSYMHNILVPPEQQRIDQLGTARHRDRGEDDDEDSGSDDQGAEAPAREVSDRASRAARKLNADFNHIGTTIAPQDVYTPYSSRSGGYNGQNVPYAERTRARPEGLLNQQVYSRQHHHQNYEMAPSLILKLKVPGIRKLFTGY